MQNKLNLRIKPDWGEIENVRNSVSDFTRSRDLSDDIINALIMVASELVENAIKYGIFHNAQDLIEISLSLDNKIIIEVKNPIDNTALPSLRYLDETIQWIRGYQDPFETYIIKLRQISTKPLQDIESGLGLVRIAYEGQSILDFYVSEDNFLHVSALYKQ